MRNLILFGLLVILLLAAQFTSAKTVEEVIDRYVRARGGMDRLLRLRSIYMEGHIPAEGAIVKITRQQNELCRTLVESAGRNTITIVLPGSALTSSPGSDTELISLSPADLRLLQMETDIAGPLVNYAGKGHAAILLGKEKLADNDCYKIKLTTPGGDYMLFWLDTRTYLLRKSSALVAAGDPLNNHFFTTYEDYKAVDGILFAHACEVKPGVNEHGAGREMVFHTILVNPMIAPELFLPEL